MSYPVQLAHLEGRAVLLAGGGAIAAQKIEPLLATGARIHLVTLEVSEAMAPHLARIERFDRRAVRREDVEGKAIVIAATDDRDANRMLSEAAQARNILVNVVDDPEACTFYAPALIQRGPVTISVGTDGASPLFAAQLRRVLEAVVPESIASAGQLFTRIRKRGLKGLAIRSKILRALADPGVGRLVDRGDTEAASARVEQLTNEREETFEPGTVALVGAGPGAKALLTLRALDRITRADVILHDALVEPEVLAMALPGTRVVNVGRRAGCTGSVEARTSQAVTNALLVREAKAGMRVVRLHAGDPFVFGRGGEEGDALDAAGVCWEVVPGISALLASAAAAKAPLTHRGEARGFTVRTGHTAAGPSSGELPSDEETIVILMGLGGAREILARLVADGHPAETPAAVVSAASRGKERVLRGTLATLAGRIEAEALEGPATILVGKVVRRAVEKQQPAGASAEEAA